MSTSGRNKVREKHIQPKLNLKKMDKTAPAAEGGSGDDDANTQRSQASSPDINASTEEPIDSQPTLANVLAAIGKLDGDMNARFNMLDSTLHQVQTSLADHTTRITDLGGCATDHDSRIAALELRCSELMEANKLTKRKLIDLEGRSRRCNIRITGLPEKVEKGNPTQFVAELLPQLLGSSNFPSALRVDRAHRIGPPASGRPRTMIARIHHPPEKGKILKLAQLQPPLTFNGARIGIYPDYPPEVTEQRRTFDGAKKKLRDAGVKYGLLFPARLMFTHGSEQKIFQDALQAETFIDKFITPGASPD